MYECGAIFFTVFTAPAWVWIGCDKEFEENHYLCERKKIHTRRFNIHTFEMNPGVNRRMFTQEVFVGQMLMRLAKYTRNFNCCFR